MYCVDKVIKSDARTGVYQVSDRQGGTYICKEYLGNSANCRREKEFYQRFASDRFRYLYLPRVIEKGEDFLVLEYIPREYLTRDSILEREWTEKDIELWVNGLLEFQQLRPRKMSFTSKRRIIEAAYPLFRAVELLIRYDRPLSGRQLLSMLWLLSSYVACRPFFRYVCTHYDFQTYNYAFVEERSKMSVLDFESSYRYGDPFFDLLYFISIPPVRIAEWTFQSRLLGRFIVATKENPQYARARRLRIRLILLVCNLARYFRFKDDADKQSIYRSNLLLLLSKAQYMRFCQHHLI